MRRSGIILHPVSLPGPGPIGDIGEGAMRFADWLHATGQRLWQVLPLGPVGPDGSPYMSCSAFAGNALLISPTGLAEAGWLPADALAPADRAATPRVDYGRASAHKQALLRSAYEGFLHHGAARSPAFSAFRQRHAFWLEDHALFMALKARFDQQPWYEWPEDIRTCDDTALHGARQRLAEELGFQRFVQFAFFQQWAALRRYCEARDIELIGDLPLYVALDSSDVWANRELFQLDAQGHPTAVAGVPPDYFSAAGQRWGNPLYHWHNMEAQDWRWWKERFRVNFEWVSCLRLDHFRGYEAYWEVPLHDLHTTRNGRWVKGPGTPFFHAMEHALGQAGVTPRFIAEDLGVITAEVDELRDTLGYPGMRILQMAFGDDPKASDYLPHNHVRNCVVYTATHDHNTSLGWFTAAPGSQTVQTAAEVARERRHALTYIGGDGSEIHWDMIRMALGSVADSALMPLQDVLGLDSNARMNLPGTTDGNWNWRFHWQALTEPVSERLRALTEVYERNSSPQPDAQGATQGLDT